MNIEFNGTYGTMYWVTDMQKSVNYFKEKFGIKPMYESKEWTEFSFNGHSLCLHGMDVDHKPLSKNGTLILKVKDIKNQVKKLKENDIKFISDIKEVHPGAFSVHWNDHDGNEYSLFEDTNQK